MGLNMCICIAQSSRTDNFTFLIASKTLSALLQMTSMQPIAALFRLHLPA